MSEYRVPGTQFTLREVIADPRKRMETAENELTALFTKILLELRISLQEFEVISSRYWARRYPGDPIKAAQEKTNAARALTSNKITWKRFDEFIQMLGVTSCRYTVDLDWPDGRKTTHAIKVTNRYKSAVPKAEAKEEEGNWNDAIKELHSLVLRLPDSDLDYVFEHEKEHPKDA